ncbi:short-chain fatty acid transporter [Clostridiales bacterium PH28_bin88]|nr:short-chain fatty acid transporter [Clostridiales bacterium PH28_bin88]
MQRLTNFFVRIARNYLPDAYLFAIILTFLAYILALLLTGKGPLELVKMWGDGMWGILAFAMQMTLILVTGHALASSKPVHAVLKALAGLPKSPVGGIMLVVFVAAIASWLQWGFGLVVGALLAREVAKAVKGVDYGMLVAAGYSGFVVWHAGISGSIPLALATSPNIVEKIAGVVPVSETIFASWNLILAWFIILTLPVLFYFMAKGKQDVVTVDPALLEEPVDAVAPAAEATFATRLENSIILNMLLGLMGVVYLVNFFAKGGSLNLNIVILIFLVAGIILHLRPINYVKAVNNAIKGAGGIALQFPLYGGIQGIMVTSGLAAIIANWFISFSTTTTFPLFTFYAGGLINLFVPSGGGQWIVQGPINIPAGAALGVPASKVAMSIAWGDAWTNMIQPFWALPLLAIAKLGIKDIMGYCTMVLIYTGIVISLGLLIF